MMEEEKLILPGFRMAGGVNPHFFEDRLFEMMFTFFESIFAVKKHGWGRLALALIVLSLFFWGLSYLSVSSGSL